MVLWGCLFRLLLSVGLPAPRYWASGRGVMLLASSVGTTTRNAPAALDGAVPIAARESAQPAGPVRPMKSVREEVEDACKSAYRSIDQC